MNRVDVRVNDFVTSKDRTVLVVDVLEGTLAPGMTLCLGDRPVYTVLGVGFGTPESWASGRRAISVEPLGEYIPKIGEKLTS